MKIKKTVIQITKMTRCKFNREVSPGSLSV